MATLQVEAYFFNAKTDYLPYYKTYTITIDEEKSFQELLEAVKEQERNFSFPKENPLAKIDSFTIEATTQVKTLIEHFGTEFRINPVSFYRSINGLIIDDSNFLASYKLLEPFCDKEDFEFYQSLYSVHFASSTFDYKKEYLGDAIAILAAHLIEKYPEQEQAILEALASDDNGLMACEYENLLLNGKDYSEVIANLKEKALTVTKETLFDKLQFIGLKEKSFILKETSNKAIALYLGTFDKEALNEAKDLIETTNNSFIPFKSATRLAGQTLLETNPSFALQKATKMLLDAYDSGAEILLFAKESDRDFFRKLLAKCERVSNRAIDLELFSLEEFKAKALASIKE